MLRVPPALAATLALLLAAPPPVAAQSPAGPLEAARASDCPAYGQHRFVDATGRFYVVLKDGSDGPWWSQRALFSFARAADERAAVQPTWVPAEEVEERGHLELVSGDALFAQGFLPAGVGLPGTVLVSSTGWGFVALAGWCDWHTHSDDVAATFVEASGRVVGQLRLWQMFDEAELLSLPFVRGPQSWLEGAWMDEEAGLVVILARGESGPIVRFVDRTTAELVEPTDEVFVAALEHEDPLARSTAIQILAESDSFEDELPTRLLEFLEDPDPAVQLCAADLLDVEGDERGLLHLESLALDPEVRLSERRGAVELLLRRHREGADSIVQSLLSSEESEGDESDLDTELQPRDDWSTFIVSVFEDIGDEAVPQLVDIVLDGSLGFGHRRRAIDTLASMGSEPALAMLTTLVNLDDANVSSRAVQLLVVRTEDRSIPGRLCDVLMHGRSHAEAAIARYFTTRKFEAAIGPLRLALERLDEPSVQAEEDADVLRATKSRIQSALAFQTAE